MRALMIDVVDQCYTFLTDLLASPEGLRKIEQLRARDPMPDLSRASQVLDANQDVRDRRLDGAHPCIAARDLSTLVTCSRVIAQ